METLIKMYIEAKQNAWAESTLQTECTRLMGLSQAITGNATTLWTELNKREMAPYSRLTAWTRVCDFWQWLLDHGHQKPGPNQYRLFRETNARHFKIEKVYKPKHVDMTVEAAAALIANIPDEAMREKAMQLLNGGLRYTESFTVANGQVMGKGGKTRDVFVDAVESTFSGGYKAFHRALKKHTGLTPHQLRKIMATQVARSGLQEADLCKAFGWSSFATAQKYVAPLKKEQLAAKFQQLQNHGKDTHDSTQEGIELLKAV